MLYRVGDMYVVVGNKKCEKYGDKTIINGFIAVYKGVISGIAYYSDSLTGETYQASTNLFLPLIEKIVPKEDFFDYLFLKMKSINPDIEFEDALRIFNSICEWR